MSDPNVIEPESLAKGGGLVVTLLALFKFFFTSGVSDVKAEVAKLNATVTTLTANVAALSTALAVANEGRVTRKEFEELRLQVTKTSDAVEHIDSMMRNGVVGHGGHG